MFKFTQAGEALRYSKGFAHVFTLLLLFLGIGVGVFLVQQRTNFLPKATSEPPLHPALEAKRASYELHGIIFPGFPTNVKKKLFDETAATGKKIVRFDIAFSDVLKDGPDTPTPSNPSPRPVAYKYDWEKADENITLAAKNSLQALVTLGQSSRWIVKNSDTCKERGRCYKDAPDPTRYDDYINKYIKEIVRRYKDFAYDDNGQEKHTSVKFYEFWNEPDLGDFKAHGTPDEYAELLARVYDAIKSVDPEAQVTIGGVTYRSFHDEGKDWLDAVMNHGAQGNKAKNKFDIANVHIRGSVPVVEDQTAKVRKYFDNIGRADAPLWITEHGYPSEPNGEKAQKEQLKDSLPAMINAGATKVFVTLRDRPDSDESCDDQGEISIFCSEGLIRFKKSNDPNSISEKPSFDAFKCLAPPGQPNPCVNPTSTPTPSPTPTPDSQPPSTSVVNPNDGSTVSGSGVSISADATDNVAVVSVSIFVDGLQVGESTSAPFTTNWDSTKVADGPHAILSKAQDSSGNLGQSTVVVVNVNNKIPVPRVRFKVEYRGQVYQEVGDSIPLKIANMHNITSDNPIKLIWTTFDNPSSCKGKSFIYSGGGTRTLDSNSLWDGPKDIQGGLFLIKNLNVPGNHTYEITCTNQGGDSRGDLISIIVEPQAISNTPKLTNFWVDIGGRSIYATVTGGILNPLSKIKAIKGEKAKINWSFLNLSTQYSLCVSSGSWRQAYLINNKTAQSTNASIAIGSEPEQHFLLYCSNEASSIKYNVVFGL